jgi:hypothetical protein
MRDPASAAPPIPWEEPERHIVFRFFGTLATALRPASSAPAFARGQVRPALMFALATFVPLALLSGIIPYTHTLVFGNLEVVVQNAETDAAIVLDVLRAAGLGLLISTIALVALAVPYVSLSRAYADRGHHAAPWRVVLYRAFLVPLFELLTGLLAFALSPRSPPEAILLAQLVAVMPLVLLFASLRAGSRMASGVGVFASIATATIPFVIMLFSKSLLLLALAPVLPAPAQSEGSGAEPASRVAEPASGEPIPPA